MRTRRQKLRDIFRSAVENGVTTEDLLNDIESFTASGKSGIETWLNETKVQNGSQPSGVDTDSLKAHLQAALDLVS